MASSAASPGLTSHPHLVLGLGVTGISHQLSTGAGTGGGHNCLQWMSHVVRSVCNSIEFTHKSRTNDKSKWTTHKCILGTMLLKIDYGQFCWVLDPEKFTNFRT